MGNGDFLETDQSASGTTELIRDAQGDLLRKIQWLADGTDSSGKTIYDYLETVYEYDSDGHQIRQSEPFTVTDASQRYTAEPTAWKTQSLYDAQGDVLQTTDALGNTTYNSYDSFGDLLTTTDALGNTTQNTYDSNGNLLSTTDAMGNTTTFTYDPDHPGLVSQVTDASGNVVSTMTYDSQGNLLTSTSASGQTTHYAYDSNGNQTLSYYYESRVGFSPPYETVVSRTDYNADGQTAGQSNT